MSPPLARLRCWRCPTDVTTASVVVLRYQGANPQATITAGERLPGVVNSFIGDIPAQWHTNTPTYRGLTYQSLYTGIDLDYAGTDGQLKSTYRVAAGADPKQIRWRYQGATDVSVDAKTGDLQITLPPRGRDKVVSALTEHAPIAWQMIGGQRRPVTASFQVVADKSVQFTLGSYDTSQPLLIDPVLSYSTYLGGNNTDRGEAIAVDASGNAYITGETLSTNFPVQGAYRGTKVGSYDAFITKLSADGQTILYSTYLGSTGSDVPYAIALDSANNIIVAGETDASGFPTTSNGQDTSFGGGTCGSEPCEDGFVTKLNSAGSALLYSSYIGGSGEDNARALAVDGSNNIYVTGFTAGGLTTSSGAYDTSFNGGTYDAFLMKLNPAASSGSASRLYSSYFGGADTDYGYGIAVQASGNVTIAGRTASNTTTSPIFPVKNAYQATKAGNADAFVARFNPATSGTAALLYSTYVGGPADDEANALALDSTGVAYLSGYTLSSTFPMLNAWQPTFGGVGDAFFTRVDPSLVGVASLLYSTFVGGSQDDRGLGLAVGNGDQIYLTGWTRSSDFPTVAPVQSANAGGTCGSDPCADAFIMRFDPTRNAPIYATYLGGAGADDEGHGIAADSSGAAYVTGVTLSTSFPTQTPRQGTLASTTGDAFVAKLVLPTVQLTLASQSVSERAGQVIVNGTLSAASTYTVTVGIATSNGTATAGSDYSPVNATLVFTPGATTASVAVPISNDTADENNETFSVALSNPFNAVLGTLTSQTVTITDDDLAPIINWQNTNVSVSEASGSVALTVWLTATSSFNVSVTYATANGTATAGSDYTTASGILTFLPGEIIKVVNVPIVTDATAEGNETFTATLSSPTNGTLGTPTSATVTIADNAAAGPGDIRTTYDRLGNRVTVGTPTIYGTQNVACAAGALTKPHAVTAMGTTNYCYDQNGNMVSSSDGRIVSWNADNQPTSITNAGVIETYAYDADGERISRVNGTLTTIYLGGMWEEPVVGGIAGAAQLYFTFGGQVVAQRMGSAISFFHGDHLGSISLVTSSAGAELSRQSFDPWGKRRSGSVSETALNYTGQRLDDTGLLYYHARYYDPELGRFLSPDTVVPGNASGGMEGVALKPLTVDFHETGFVSGLRGENGQAFWFQTDRKSASPFGPKDPQGLNRYSYVRNNPVRWTDPTGHADASPEDEELKGAGPSGGSTGPGMGNGGGWNSSRDPSPPLQGSPRNVRVTDNGYEILDPSEPAYGPSGRLIATRTGRELSEGAQTELHSLEMKAASFRDGDYGAPPWVTAQRDALRELGHRVWGEQYRKYLIRDLEKKIALGGGEFGPRGEYLDMLSDLRSDMRVNDIIKRYK